MDVRPAVPAAARKQGFTTMRLATAELHTRAPRFSEREGRHVTAGPFEAPGMELATVEYRRAL